MRKKPGVSRVSADKSEPSRKRVVTRKTNQPRGIESPSPLRRQLIYIHGIGIQPPLDIIKRDWDFALFGEDMGDRSTLARWADILHPDEQPVGRRRTRAVGQPPGDDEGVLNLTPKELVAGIPAARRKPAEKYAESLEQTLRDRERETGAVQTRGMRAKVLPLPEWLRRPITERLVKLLIHDTAAYFYDPVRRDEIRRRLHDKLVTAQRANLPVVLVSHSQGTVVAYEVLHALKGSVDIELFVTMGSPLGLQEVQDQLGKPLRVPPSVKSWLNVADILDPVAFDKNLASEFTPATFIHDRLVLNRDTVRFDPHSGTGYLATDVVRDAVRSAMGVREELTRGRFFRRDVLAAMRDRADRHAVLIELLDDKTFARNEEARNEQPSAAVVTALLDTRRDELKQALERIVGGSGARAAEQVKEARIDPLRRFIAARLTASEIEQLEQFRETHVYCVWRNSPKRKLVKRSADVIHVPASRTAYRADGRDVTWAVLDTGVLSNHPHFTLHSNIREVWDCTQTGAPVRLYPGKTAKVATTDRDGHGTHVAGIIAGEESDPPASSAASTKTGQNVAVQDARKFCGMAPRAKLHVYKVLDDQGNGDDGWIIKALDHISRTNEGASGLVVHGLNLSLGGSFDPEVYGCGHSPICQELGRLWRQGVLVCVACGNEGQVNIETDSGWVGLNTMLSVGDPANLEDCIAVGSVNADQPHNYGISYFSSRGPTADGRMKPDVIAPGERITSCNSDLSHDAYMSMSGTSMACPHVSGLLAAFLSVRREFIGRPDEVKRILLANCTDIGRDRYHQGRGIPNLVKMLTNT